MKNNSGNALWFILIVVFLLGGLTVLLTRTSTTTEETGDNERLSIRVSELLRYTGGLAQTIERMRANGCSESDISFYSTKWTFNGWTYDNTNTPVAGAIFDCHVFNTAGGGYPFKTIPTGLGTATDYVIAGTNAVNNVGTGNLDLVLLVPNLNQAACEQINRTIGIQSFAKDGASILVPFVGAYSPYQSQIGDDNVNPAYIQGKKAACMQALALGGLTNDSYFFYQVLIAR